jgi:hypothetical protein
MDIFKIRNPRENYHPQLENETTTTYMSPPESFLSCLVNGYSTFEILPDNARVHHAIEQHKLKIAHKDEDFFLRHRLTLRSEIPRRQVSKQRSRWDAMANTESQSVTSMRLMAPKRRPVRIETSNDPTQYSKL